MQLEFMTNAINNTEKECPRENYGLYSCTGKSADLLASTEKAKNVLRNIYIPRPYRVRDFDDLIDRFPLLGGPLSALNEEDYPYFWDTFGVWLLERGRPTTQGRLGFFPSLIGKGANAQDVFALTFATYHRWPACYWRDVYCYRCYLSRIFRRGYKCVRHRYKLWVQHLMEEIQRARESDQLKGSKSVLRKAYRSRADKSLRGASKTSSASAKAVTSPGSSETTRPSVGWRDREKDLKQTTAPTRGVLKKGKAGSSINRHDIYVEDTGIRHYNSDSLELNKDRPSSSHYSSKGNRSNEQGVSGDAHTQVGQKTKAELKTSSSSSSGSTVTATTSEWTSSVTENTLKSITVEDLDDTSEDTSRLSLQDL
ncbi:uncharacterized protein [Ptychodera flava]|uniref:uncharacterized protein n=1 Tax=Ptychodera flava TaxID=63121 RepID=UPI003969BD56